jgi:hypothetical protein
VGGFPWSNNQRPPRRARPAHPRRRSPQPCSDRLGCTRQDRPPTTPTPNASSANRPPRRNYRPAHASTRPTRKKPPLSKHHPTVPHSGRQIPVSQQSVYLLGFRTQPVRQQLPGPRPNILRPGTGPVNLYTRSVTARIQAAAMCGAIRSNDADNRHRDRTRCR